MRTGSEGVCVCVKWIKVKYIKNYDLRTTKQRRKMLTQNHSFIEWRWWPESKGATTTTTPTIASTATTLCCLRIFIALWSKGHTIERCMKTSRNVTNPKRKYSLWLFHHSLRKEHTHHHHHKEHNIHMTALRKIELGHVQGLANNIYIEQPYTKIFSLFNFTGGGSNSFLNVGKLENDLRCWYAARGISLEIEQQ